MVVHVGRLGGVSIELHACPPFSACSHSGVQSVPVLYTSHVDGTLVCVYGFHRLALVAVGEQHNSPCVPCLPRCEPLLMNGPRVPIELSDTVC